MNLNNNHGFTLVETLVSISILTIVGLGIGALVTQSANQMAQTSARVERNSLQSSVEAVLKKPYACDRNMNVAGIKIRAANPVLTFSVLRDYADNNPTSIATLVPGLNQPIAAGSKLRASAMKITGPGGTGAPILISTVGTIKSYLSDVVIEFAPTDKTVAMKPVIVPSIIMKTDLAGNFSECSASSVQAVPETTCAALGMVWKQYEPTRSNPNPGGGCVQNAERTCAELGGTINATTGKCEVVPALTMACPAGQAVNRFDGSGQPVCEPLTAGVWGPWPTSCPTGCGSATVTRSCIAGNCSGASSKTCSQYNAPYIGCTFTCVSTVPLPDSNNPGGGGQYTICSATACPPNGTRVGGGPGSYCSPGAAEVTGSVGGPTWTDYTEIMNPY